MCAVWLKLITFLCLSCTALSGPESGGVVYRDLGGVVTIQCRISETNEEFLTLKKGINEDHVFHKEGSSEKNIIGKEHTGRIQFNGAFPNLDILIKNLTSDDTGPYWCVYTKFDQNIKGIKATRGTGSVLLVVTAPGTPCDPASNNLVLVSVVISAAVLLGIIICFLIWIILKTKSLRSTVKPRRVTTNDVYEDMRGTLRR